MIIPLFLFALHIMCQVWLQSECFFHPQSMSSFQNKLSSQGLYNFFYEFWIIWILNMNLNMMLMDWLYKLILFYEEKINKPAAKNRVLILLSTIFVIHKMCEWAIVTTYLILLQIANLLSHLLYNKQKFPVRKGILYILKSMTEKNVA